MIGKYKNIIIVLVIIVLGVVAYAFLKPDPTATSLLATTQRQDSAQVLGDDITSAISQINSLKLDRGVLDDPIVAKLINHNKKITSIAPGRKNPFAPVGDDSSVGSATSTTSIKMTTSTSTTAATSTSTKTSTSTVAH